MKKMICALLVILLLVSVTVPAMAAGTETVDQLNVALSKGEGFLNPYSYASETGYWMLHLVYDSLFILDEHLNITPWLVETYEYDEAALTYTFKLHDGVTFHDGEKLTAEDVKFTYDYLAAHPKSRFSQPAAVISEITVIDELTLTMTLSAPSADFLDKPLCEMPILPEHIWSQVEDPDTCDNNIGSGAFRVTEMADGEYYILEKNENYWNGTVAVDMLYMPIISDGSTRQTALLTGELDATTANLSAEVIEEFASGNFKIYQGAGFPSTMMYFNCDRAPFDNVEFRKALSLAIDRQDIVDTVMLGYATPGTNSHVHPVKNYYDASVEEPGFDPAAAAAILDELGYVDTDGDGIREMNGEALSFTIYVYASNTARIRIAELLKAWWAEIGIGLELSALDMDTVDNIVWPGYVSAHDLDYDLVMWGWGASTMSIGYANRLWNSDLAIGSSNVGAFGADDVDAAQSQPGEETVENAGVLQDGHPGVGADEEVHPHGDHDDGHEHLLGLGIGPGHDVSQGVGQHQADEGGDHSQLQRAPEDQQIGVDLFGGAVLLDHLGGGGKEPLDVLQGEVKVVVGEGVVCHEDQRHQDEEHGPQGVGTKGSIITVLGDPPFFAGLLLGHSTSSSSSTSLSSSSSLEKEE